MSDELIDAEELARGYSVVQLAETAEEYFASVTDWTYHLSKPLGSIAEAPTILSHFGAMLSALRLEVGLNVLDFGAGSCWTSRMLTQLGCHVVACDVSSTALAMGRRLFELQPPLGRGTVQFLRFDGTTIDMPDGSVDRICCMDAFHHVPNWEEVLAEFHRLLRPGGRAVLAESGPDHSRTAQAQSEMRNFTVVERDVVVEDLAKLATAAGFANTTVGIYGGLPFLVPAERFAEELAIGRSRSRRGAVVPQQPPARGPDEARSSSPNKPEPGWTRRASCRRQSRRASVCRRRAQQWKLDVAGQRCRGRCCQPWRAAARCRRPHEEPRPPEGSTDKGI